MELEADALVRAIERLVRRGELDIDPFLQRLVLGRGQHGIPLLHVADPVDDLGLREDFLDVFVPQIGGVGRVGVLLHEEVLEIAADEGLVVLDSGMEGNLLVIRAEVSPIAAELIAVEILRTDIVDVPRELEVLHEAVLVVLAQGPVEDQPPKQDVRFQGVL